MVAKQMTRRVLRELAAERASHGHGEAASIDRRMNKARGYLSRILRGDLSLQVETLFEALEVLEVDAADFFGRVTGTRVSADRLLRRLERRAASDGPSLLDRFEITVASDRIEVMHGFDGRPEALNLSESLRDLDEELFSYPDRALRSAEDVLRAALHGLEDDPVTENVDLFCRALGALAAAYRVHARFGSAARCLRIGFRLCEAQGLTATRADLLLRTCYLLGDHGEYDLAVELARQASDSCLFRKDREDLGRALVVRAIMHNLAGDWTAAIEAYNLGLEYLPEEIWIGRWSCYQGLGRIYTEQGSLEDARHAVGQAATTHRTSAGQNWWRLIWLQGDIALKEKDFESAELLLREARGGLLDLGNPLDVALVSLRLAKALLMAGRVAEMRTLAAEMMRLLKPLEKNRIAGGAVYEFTCAALTGEVTVHLLDSIYKKLEESASTKGGTREVR